MTPKEKADVLFHRYFDLLPLEAQITDTAEIANDKCVEHYQLAKSCSVIAIDEIIDDIPMYLGNLNPKWYYWNEVKKELENY